MNTEKGAKFMVKMASGDEKCVAAFRHIRKCFHLSSHNGHVVLEGRLGLLQKGAAELEGGVPDSVMRFEAVKQQECAAVHKLYAKVGAEKIKAAKERAESKAKSEAAKKSNDAGSAGSKKGGKKDTAKKVASKSKKARK